MIQLFLLTLLMLSSAINIKAENSSLNFEDDYTLTEQIKSEYQAYYELCKNTFPDFDTKVTQIIVYKESGCPTLYNMIQEVATKLNLPMPTIQIHKKPLFNALAVQFHQTDTGTIIIGSSLITDAKHGLTYAELKAVIAHELAHLKHQHVPRRISKLGKSLAISYGSTIGAALVLAIYSPRLRSFISKHILLTQSCISTIASIGMMPSFLKLARAQEVEADQTSIAANGDPLSLINALNKLDQGNQEMHPLAYKVSHWLPSSLSTHPAQDERETYLKALI